MKTAAPSSTSAVLRPDSEITPLPESAQRQLDALRSAVDVRLAALDAALADPSRGESLATLILDLARLSTEEAQAAATRACATIKLEADTEIAQARKSAQQALEHERIVSADFRRALEQAEQRLATLEREKQNDLRAIREQFDQRLAQERLAGDQIERMAADLERRLAEASQKLEAEKRTTLELRGEIDRAEGVVDALRREQAQGLTQQQQTIEQLKRDLAAEQARLAEAERAHGDTRAALAAERASTTELRAAAERIRAQSASAESTSEERLMAQRAAETALGEEKRRTAEARQAMAQVEAALERERTTVAALKDTIARTEALCAELERKRVDAQTRYDHANEYTEKERRLATELSKGKADADAALEREQTITRELRATVDRLQKELGKAGSADAALETERATTAALRDTLARTEALCAELERKRVDAQTKYDNANEYTEKERRRANDLSKAKADAEGALERERALTLELRGTVERLQLEVSRASSDSEEHAAGHDALRDAVLAARNENHRLRAELDAAKAGQQIIEDLRVETRGLEMALENERSTSSGLRRTITELESAMARAAAESAQHMAGSGEARQALADARAQTSKLEADLAAARGAAQELSTVQASLATARGELATLEAERAASGALAKRIEALEAALAAARQESEQAVSQARTAEARAEESAADAKTRLADLEWLRTRNGELETQHASLDAAWHDAEAQLEKITRERDQLALQLEATRQSLAGTEPASRTAPPPAKPAAAKAEPAASKGETKDAKAPRAAAKAPAPELIPSPSSSRVSNTDEAWGHVRLSTRYKFTESIAIGINNGDGVLADLSTGGCQLQSRTALKPKQAVKVALPLGDKKSLTCSGKVVWAHLEPPTKGQPLTYRAGVQFANADHAAIEAFITAHGIKL